MQGRSWMAALSLALVAAIAPGLSPASPCRALADGPREPSPAATTPARPADLGGAGEKLREVRLELRIAGLASKGCDVEIKPGHPGCKFQAVSRHVDPEGRASVVVKDVLTRNADRDCTFAITIREPGQAERTHYRGLRISAGEGPGPLLTCYLSSPSRIARNSTRTGTTKR